MPSDGRFLTHTAQEGEPEGRPLLEQRERDFKAEGWIVSDAESVGSEMFHCPKIV